MDAEVIVVGGGPAGSVTAALLAQSGRDVLLFDRAHFPRDKACAEYLSPATADALDRVGALPAVEALRPVRPLGMQLIVGGQGRAMIRYPDGGTARRALCLPRVELDAVLVDHARLSGARVLEGHQVCDVRADADGVQVFARAVAEPATSRRAWQARVVVGADGSRSAVTRSLGLDRRAVWPQRVGLVARFAVADRWAELTQCGQMHVGRGVYCGLAPLPDHRVNVGLVMYGRAVRRAGGTERAFAAGLSHVPAVADVLVGAERVGPIRGVAPLARRVAPPSGDGFVLVGDAAGFLDPFTGEGVFRAVRGAELAAETIDDALQRRTASAAALAPYAARRRTEFAAKEALCWLIQGLLLSPAVLAYALRRLEQRAQHRAVLGGVLGDYRPAQEALRPAFLWGLLRP
jgi:geranylgeranyl reductase family protein